MNASARTVRNAVAGCVAVVMLAVTGCTGTNGDDLAASIPTVAPITEIASQATTDIIETDGELTEPDEHCNYWLERGDAFTGGTLGREEVKTLWRTAAELAPPELEGSYRVVVGALDTTRIWSGPIPPEDDPEVAGRVIFDYVVVVCGLGE